VASSLINCIMIIKINYNFIKIINRDLELKNNKFAL